MNRSLIVLGLVTGLSVTGCASNGTKTAKSEPKPTTTTEAQFVAHTSNTPGTLKNFVGARQDVHDTNCAPHDGRWRASGKATNSSKQSVTYRIYVSFLDGETTTGIAQTDITQVAGGATADWTAAVAAPGKGLRCVLRVERATI